MDIETLLQDFRRNVPERSETELGNVPELRMFHVCGVTLVPVLFKVAVHTHDVDAACLQFADFVGSGPSSGLRCWDYRSPAYVSRIYEASERSALTDLIVPKRYRVPQWR